MKAKQRANRAKPASVVSVAGEKHSSEAKMPARLRCSEARKYEGPRNAAVS